MRKWYRLYGPLLVAIFGCAACAERPLDAELLTEQFTLVAIEDRDEGAVIRKWTEDLRFHLSGDQAAIAKYRTSIESHVAAYGALTGLATNFVDERDQANAVIVFVRRSDFATTLQRLSNGRLGATDNERNEIGRTLCITFRADRDTRLEFTLVLIGTDNERAILRECIPHELAHALGTNHSNLIVPSIFSDQNYLINAGAGILLAPIVALAWHDRLILRTLYDKRLKPGMQADEAGPIVRQIIGELIVSMKP